MHSDILQAPVAPWQRLSARLRGQWLARAQRAVDESMAELGGGQARVSQRLRSTLARCASGLFPGLHWDATSDELARAWRLGRAVHGQLQGCKTAASFFRMHARRVRDVGRELRAHSDLIKALVRQAHHLAKRDESRSADRNAGRPGAHQRAKVGQPSLSQSHCP